MTQNRIVTVVWKDEGDFGFITTVTEADLAADRAGTLGLPYDPNRVQAYGTIEDAEALAAEHDAKLELS
jgi:hypothetical protein